MGKKVLFYHADPFTLSELETAVETNGCTIDFCEGILQMLRLIEKDGYDIVVLNANHLNMEVCALLGTIEALKKKPKILLSLSEPNDPVPQILTALDHPVIRGPLTCETFLEVVREYS